MKKSNKKIDNLLVIFLIIADEIMQRSDDIPKQAFFKLIHDLFLRRNLHENLQEILNPFIFELIEPV